MNSILMMLLSELSSDWCDWVLEMELEEHGLDTKVKTITI